MTTIDRDLAILDEIAALTDLPAETNALGVAFGRIERPDLWTTTRAKALKVAARRWGLEISPAFFGFEITDPVTGLRQIVDDPRRLARALDEIYHERSMALAGRLGLARLPAVA